MSPQSRGSRAQKTNAQRLPNSPGSEELLEAEKSLDVSRRRGENYHGFLVRVRSEFLRYHKFLDETRSVQRFFSEDFERWRLRQLRGGDASDDEDYTSGGALKKLVPRSLDDPFSAEAEEEPLTAWPEQLLGLEREPIVGSPEGSAKALSRTLSRALSRGTSEAEPDREATARPFSAPATRVLKTVQLDHKVARKQVRGLQRIYTSASVEELPSAAAAMTDFVRRGEDGARIAGRFRKAASKETAEESSDSRMAAALERLRSRGLRPQASTAQSGGGGGGGEGGKAEGGDASSQGGRAAPRQWLKQLAKDYPDEFCRVPADFVPGDSMAPSILAEGVQVVGQELSRAVLSSVLWVLDLHGDPLNEKCWQRRLAWLSASGCLWLGPSESESSCQDCSVQFGGERVADLQVLRARQGIEVAAAILGQPIFAIRLDSVGPRYTRRKYLAADDEETCEKWLKACEVPVTRQVASDSKSTTLASSGAFGASARTVVTSALPSANPRIVGLQISSSFCETPTSFCGPTPSSFGWLTPSGSPARPRAISTAESCKLSSPGAPSPGHRRTLRLPLARALSSPDLRRSP
ncbi:unnamed protein product [Polarella glacialis]|uniref:Uncharacterized protein n=1 Tax=Polarella glacialis TaxID=89957 RepID=A0A813FWH5_POLGL|nr:unnamed protein product [Polarella glacialis]